MTCSVSSKKVSIDKNDPNKKYYFETISLELLKKQNLISDVTLWEKNKEYYQEVFDFEQFSLNGVNLLFKANILKKILGPKLIKRSVLFKMDGEGHYYFGQGILAPYDSALSYHLEIIGDIFLSQRRKDYRLELFPLEKKKIFAKWNRQPIEIFDISAGGMCCYVPEAFLDKIQPPATIAVNLQVYFENFSFSLPNAKIIKIEEGMAHLQKISLAFLNISQDYHQELALLIYDKVKERSILKKLKCA